MLMEKLKKAYRLLSNLSPNPLFQKVLSICSQVLWAYIPDDNWGACACLLNTNGGTPCIHNLLSFALWPDIRLASGTAYVQLTRTYILPWWRCGHYIKYHVFNLLNALVSPFCQGRTHSCFLILMLGPRISLCLFITLCLVSLSLSIINH